MVGKYTPLRGPNMRPQFWRGFLAGFFFGAAIGGILGIGLFVGIGKAQACDPGQYYDPQHQICQGSAPAYPQPGFGPWQNNYPGFPQAPSNPGNYPPGGWGR